MWSKVVFLLIIILSSLSVNFKAMDVEDNSEIFNAITKVSDPVVVGSSYLLNYITIEINVTQEIYNPNNKPITVSHHSIYSPDLFTNIVLLDPSIDIFLMQLVAPLNLNQFEFEIPSGLHVKEFQAELHTNTSKIPLGNYSFFPTPLSYWGSRTMVERYNYTISVSPDITKHFPPELPFDWGLVDDELINAQGDYTTVITISLVLALPLSAIFVSRTRIWRNLKKPKK